MSASFFPIGDDPLLAPQFQTTHYAEGILYDPDSEQGFIGATGLFNLWREGVQIVTNRTMTGASTLPDGWVRCVVTNTEMGQWGYYRWTMTMTTADGGYTLNEEGEFTL